MFIHLYIACGCFHYKNRVKVLQMRPYTHKAYKIFSCPLWKKFTDSSLAQWQQFLLRTTFTDLNSLLIKYFY